MLCGFMIMVAMTMIVVKIRVIVMVMGVFFGHVKILVRLKQTHAQNQWQRYLGLGRSQNASPFFDVTNF